MDHSQCTVMCAYGTDETVLREHLDSIYVYHRKLAGGDTVYTT